MTAIPQKVAEFGPGDSCGIGLAAMLSGCNKIFALAHLSPQQATEYYGGLATPYGVAAKVLTSPPQGAGN